MSNQLLKEINPIYLTAKQTIRDMADRGDGDAVKIVDYLDKYKEKEQFRTNYDSNNLIFRGFASVAEYRYGLMNNILENNIKENYVLDMPCGYTSRGLRFAKAHKRYCGADLPAVINDMKDAVYSIIEAEDKKYVTYSEVDATNADSIENAIKDCNGPLCITTEGLLSYFTDPELDAVFSAIHGILLKHGGCWITPDREIRFYMENVFKVIANGDKQMMKAMAEELNAIRMKSDSAANNNSFYKADLNESINITERAGFHVERIQVSQYIPDLKTLMPIREGIMEDLRNSCKDIAVWKLTVSDAKQDDHKEDKFSLHMEKDDHRVIMHLAGRIDTLSAPEIVKMYDENASVIKSIIFDFRKVSYISSAGLRALLIIFKKIGNKENFNVINCNETVYEIFETTGFRDVLM